MPRTGTILVSIRWGLHVGNRTPTSSYFSWKRCWLVFSYHGEFSRFQVSKYIEYSAYTGCISLYIYCLITCNIKSLLNVPKISYISRKISQVSRFPAKSPDSRNEFVFLPKQPLLELSPPVLIVFNTHSITNIIIKDPFYHNTIVHENELYSKILQVDRIQIPKNLPSKFKNY